MTLIGTWQLIGHTLDSKEDNISGWTTFEWLAGGFFLQAIGEIDFKGAMIMSVEIIAYDEVVQTFPSSVYSNMSGNVFPYHWNVQGDTVTHWMDTSEFSATFSEDGNTLSGG